MRMAGVARRVHEERPPTVLLSDDGRFDGSGEASGGSGDGDAGRQRADGSGADHATIAMEAEGEGEDQELMEAIDSFIPFAGAGRTSRS